MGMIVTCYERIGIQVLFLIGSENDSKILVKGLIIMLNPGLRS